jgi:hypothetical protein
MRATKLPADLSLLLVSLVLVSFLTAAIWQWDAGIGAETRIARDAAAVTK